MPRHSQAPYNGLTLHVRLANAPVDRMRDEKAVVVVLRNQSNRERTFGVQLPKAQLFGLDGRPHGALFWSDVIGGTTVTLAPGEVQRFRARVAALRCGDTEWLSHPLSRGRYDLIAMVH